MKKMYGYIRVSTNKQGDGVSLEEQELAIVRYAQNNDLKIVQWFEEKTSASKKGRRAFNQMMGLLKRKSCKVDGVIIHKIDRGSRNMKDWSEISQLSDSGIDVRFAHDNVELNSRSSRLLADMQAVIAIDYSRNLSEEAKKGIYGRLRQGIYPFNAPVGYLNTGKGEVKAIDPVKAPLVVKMFKLYATGEYSQKRLREKMTQLGLTNSKGNPLCKNNIMRMLHNPFYMGIIRIVKTGETFEGKHKPLISSTLYEEVQERLGYKANPKPRKHTPLYRGLIRCARCHYAMPAERQKGRFYYRCQQKHCETKTIREDRMSKAISRRLQQVCWPEDSRASLHEEVERYLQASTEEGQEQKRALRMQLGKIDIKLDKLADLLLDGVIPQEAYIKKQASLHLEKVKLTENMQRCDENKDKIVGYIQKILELGFSFKLQVFERLGDQKREMSKIFTSNLQIDGRKPLIELKAPFHEMVKIRTFEKCTPSRATTRKKGAKNTESVKNIMTEDAAKQLITQLIKIYREEGDLIEVLNVPKSPE